MARITRGILGGGRGKVANVVMGQWKGIDYLRAYATPSNPRTESQTSVRTTFAAASQAASILNNFLRLIPDQKVRQSNYNYAVTKLFEGETLVNTLQSFGTTNEPSVVSLVLPTGELALQGQFIRNDRIIAAVFQVASGRLTGVFGVAQQTITSETMQAITMNPYEGTAGRDVFVPGGVMCFTILRGAARRVVAFELA